MRYTNRSYATIPWTSQAQGTAGTLASQALAHGAKGQTINGVYCVSVSTYNADNVQAGTMCVSPDLGIVVRRELDGYMNGKRVVHWVEEMANIQFTEPNAGLFSIPQGYKQVAAPQHSDNCVK